MNMEFRTKIDIERSASQIAPCARMLFVGSCFADSIGKRFEEERFPVTVNPFGTMDNCQKRPQRLFEERVMTVDECAQWLQRSVDALTARDAETHIVFTVSPIRYRKYGYHESQLSKATLLLAVDKVLEQNKQKGTLSYFPAYEIVNDELRDYRFYAEDMIHPSGQAVEYIWERLVDTYFSDDAKHYLEEWRPLKEALGHRPFNAESEEYRLFMQKTREKIAALSKKYPNFAELI